MRKIFTGTIAIVLLFCSTSFSMASSHSRSIAEAALKMNIPLQAVVHSDVQKWESFQAQILQLSTLYGAQDATTKALLTYVSAQNAACGYGAAKLFPGSLTNENNIFHVCRHSMVAGVKALGDNLTRIAPSAVTSAYQADMTAYELQDMINGNTLNGCKYSYIESLNTATIQYPPINPLTMAILLLLAILTACAGVFFGVKNVKWRLPQVPHFWKVQMI